MYGWVGQVLGKINSLAASTDTASQVANRAHGAAEWARRARNRGKESERRARGERGIEERRGRGGGEREGLEKV
eukprot:1639725-Rhodomonas_salina.2